MYTQKKVTGKSNRFDEPAPQVAHTLMEMENQTRTAAIITRDQITLGQRIGEGAHGSVYEGTWANVHGSVRTCIYYYVRVALWGFPPIPEGSSIAGYRQPSHCLLIKPNPSKGKATYM